MPQYIVLWKFTDQGAKTLKDSVEAADRNTQAAAEHGVKVTGSFWTQGQYDFVSILEAPDENSVMAGLLTIASRGNARSECLRAFDAQEMQTIIQQMT